MKIRIKEKVFCNIFCVFAGIMFFTLFYYSLSLTGTHGSQYADEHIYFRQDSLLANCFLLFLGIFAFGIWGKIYDKVILKINRNVVLAVFCLISLAISLCWVAEVKAVPQADQLAVCEYANDFNQGDFSGLKKGKYLSINSWQLGLVSLLRIVFNIFGHDNWRAFQYLSACMVPLIVFAGCQIIRLITENNGKMEWYYQLFSVTCVPAYVYTVFVYGEIISTALVMVVAWLMISCFKKFSWAKAITMSLILGVAVQLRRNVLIVLIAFLITALIKSLAKRSWKIMLAGICMLAGVVLVHFIHWGCYTDHIDPEAESLPASLYIVMGLNDDYGRSGWYNAYHYNTFATLDYDVEKANAKAREDLIMYINIYKSKPEYFVDFFERKMNAQWNAPMYQCLKMNNNIYEEMSPLISDIFHVQRIGKVIDWGMKVYQLVLYAGILVWIIASMKKQKGIEQYALLIAVFGGFLFSLMWEAKTRYVFPYLLLMLPYGAMGVHMIINKLEQRNKHQRIDE